MSNPKNAYTSKLAHELLTKHVSEVDFLNHWYDERELFTADGTRLIQTTPYIVIKFKGYM
jgi:hypothetical protein